MDKPPVRVCCGHRHFGVQCPDGTVMCCLCFGKFSITELAVEDGGLIDVCKPCYQRDQPNARETPSNSDATPERSDRESFQWEDIGGRRRRGEIPYRHWVLLTEGATD